MYRCLLRSIAVGSVATAVFACGGTTNPTPVFSSVVVSSVSNSVAMGSSITLTVIAKDQNGATFSGAPAPTWASSSETAATVTASGVVTGVAAGASTISASITAGDVTHVGTLQILVVGTTIPNPNPRPNSYHVTATTGQAFTPETISVHANRPVTVTWTFQSLAHTVTWDGGDGGVADIPRTANGNVTRTFHDFGTWSYHCSIHPNMTGIIAVW
jgi:plastocyanin